MEQVAKTSAATRIPVKVWRTGKELDVAVPPGKLGIRLHEKPAPEAVVARRAHDELVRSGQGKTWAPLPATRAEVAAIAKLFAAPHWLTLLGSEASEQRLDELASAGELARFRYLHFATHGELNSRMAMQSALVLAQDRLPDPLAQVLAGRDVYDGRLTAEHVLRFWKLDADLVTLSACRSGVSDQYYGGEGYLGFAQALFLKGARSLVVSQWKVDDRATALLMMRFYENLLGARPGLPQALPKAQALAEAKRWLRQLTGREVDELMKGLPGQERGTKENSPRALDPLRPFQHPFY